MGKAFFVGASRIHFRIYNCEDPDPDGSGQGDGLEMKGVTPKSPKGDLLSGQKLHPAPFRVGVKT